MSKTRAQMLQESIDHAYERGYGPEQERIVYEVERKLQQGLMNLRITAVVVTAAAVAGILLFTVYTELKRRTHADQPTPSTCASTRGASTDQAR